MSRRKVLLGFTLIEILIVLAILAILIGLVSTGVVFGVRIARSSSTSGLVARINSALEQYHTNADCYPSGAPAYPEYWPDPYDKKGVELDAGFLNNMPGEAAHFTKDDFDQADPARFVDAWGRRIRYRMVNRHMMLAWSVGPDGVDQIGLTDDTRAGDDLSSADMK